MEIDNRTALLLKQELTTARKRRDEWRDVARADINDRRARQYGEYYNGFVEGIQQALAIMGVAI